MPLPSFRYPSLQAYESYLYCLLCFSDTFTHPSSLTFMFRRQLTNSDSTTYSAIFFLSLLRATGKRKEEKTTATTKNSHRRCWGTEVGQSRNSLLLARAEGSKGGILLLEPSEDWGQEGQLPEGLSEESCQRTSLLAENVCYARGYLKYPQPPSDSTQTETRE